MGEAGQARWKTSSTSSVSGTVTSWRISSKRWSSSRCSTLVREPVKKLSRQTTSCPSFRSLSQRCEPKKPEPPLTRIRRRDMRRFIPAKGGDCKSRRQKPPAGPPVLEGLGLMIELLHVRSHRGASRGTAHPNRDVGGRNDRIGAVFPAGGEPVARRATPRAHHSAAGGNHREPHLHAAGGQVSGRRLGRNRLGRRAGGSADGREVRQPDPGCARQDRRFSGPRGSLGVAQIRRPIYGVPRSV